mgnify:CR=1 FL=1
MRKIFGFCIVSITIPIVHAKVTSDDDKKNSRWFKEKMEETELIPNFIRIINIFCIRYNSIVRKGIVFYI